MYKFQFNLQTQTLKIVEADRFLVFSEDHQFRKLGGIGFILDHSEPPNRWITFSVYKEKVRVIYKNGSVYYQRELIRPSSGIVEVEFSKWDQLTKKSKSERSPDAFNKKSEQSEQ
ncbi:MAG: hypothetical protein I3270_02540 [Candidatus Moeniiplasma glomeromycotorum]|nr:hypothetical protein [Candidatus Moeniiplasma glomeromycotorum]MCE8162575.1 hypothetical protein [Candidatus Moeniiplasma glomeromycotorum]MCE8166501.1 hypothetical protein [Candidatus Moeniiplasma glomeromycotorum]MCE8166958.1 hypothetical protein [Candidatus Moeniiplasma glomeromycotorum]